MKLNTPTGDLSNDGLPINALLVPACFSSPECFVGRVEYDLSHRVTLHNKPKPIDGASMHLWLVGRIRHLSEVLLAARSPLSLVLHQTDAHLGDIFVK